MTYEEHGELFEEVWEQVRRQRVGMMTRPNPGWWKRAWNEKDWFRAVYRGDGQVEGYVVYRVENEWRRSLPAGTLQVLQLVTATEEAHAALWAFCFGIDLVAKLECQHRPVDDPLPWMLADPRRLQRSTYDGLWVRVLDVPAALSGRRYNGEGKLVFEVSDSFCPWVSGRYELEAGTDGAGCRPSRSSADITLSAADLGAIYLGGVKPSTLARAGRLESKNEVAVETADVLFATSPAPWAGLFF